MTGLTTPFLAARWLLVAGELHLAGHYSANFRRRLLPERARTGASIASEDKAAPAELEPYADATSTNRWWERGVTMKKCQTMPSGTGLPTMNRSIRAVTIFAALLVVALIANLTYIHAFQHEKFAENPRNARQYLKSKSQERGQITAGKYWRTPKRMRTGTTTATTPPIPHNMDPLSGTSPTVSALPVWKPARTQFSRARMIHCSLDAPGIRLRAKNSRGERGSHPAAQCAKVAYEQLASRGFSDLWWRFAPAMARFWRCPAPPALTPPRS